MGFKNEMTENLIGKDSIFEGDFEVNGDLRVEGKFSGDLRVEGQLIVGEKGKVKTNVQAKQVIIGGIFIGDIEAREEVILLNTGKVLGNIKTPILKVNKGVISQGKIEITSNQYQGEELKNIVEESFRKKSGVFSEEFKGGGLDGKREVEEKRESKVKNIIGKVFEKKQKRKTE